MLAAALEAFTEKGFAGARLDDIARRARISKGTLYLYFPGKEELFKAVVRDGLVSPLVAIREVIDSFPGSSAELLRRFILGWWDLIGNTRLGGLPKLMIAEAANFPEIARFYLDEVILPAHAITARVVVRGVASGEFRAVDADKTATLITAPFISISAWRHGFDHAMQKEMPALADGRALLEAHIEMLIRGLAAEPKENGA
ncbi:MAG: TetR/AcrR family transcriptional regulator [Burkholderiales bacterium]